MKNLTLQQIFTEANYTVDFDNRSYFCKSVNTINCFKELNSHERTSNNDKKEIQKDGKSSR